MSKQEKFLLASILILGTILRLVFLFRYGHFWDDEMFSVVYSQKSWLASWQFWLWETNPPLHMILLKFWFYLLPVTELSARLPSLIFGLGNIILAYFFGKKLFGKTAATISAFYLSILPYHIFLSVTARTYSLLLFLITASFYLFYKIFFESDRSLRTIALYATVTFLSLFSHLTAGAVFVCQLIIIIIFKNSWRDWLKINLLPFTLAASWIIPSLIFKSNIKTATGAWFLNLSSSLSQTLSQISLIFGGYLPAISTGIIIFIILILIVQSLWQDHKQKLIIIPLVWIIFPLSTALLLGLDNIKFFAIIIPAVTILLGYLLSRIFAKKTIILTPLILIFLCYSGFIYTYHQLPLSNWTTTCEQITKAYQPNTKQIFIYNNPFLKNQINYYCPTLAIKSLGYYPFPTDWDYDYITSNYIFGYHSESEIQNWIKQNHVNQYQNIVLLQDEYKHMPNIATVLEENGYQKTASPTPAHILGKYNIYYYEKSTPTSTKK